MRTSNQTPVFSFRLPIDLREDLDQLAKERNLTISTLIVEILRKEVDAHNETR